MELTPDSLPTVRGKLLFGTPLAPYTWFRVGGPADILFLPADEEDLAAFLAGLPVEVPVTVLGVGSNLIIRDGGLEGVTVRLAGGYWGAVEQVGAHEMSARAGALDLAVAMRTNAGCYGRELKDVLTRVHGIDRAGNRISWGHQAGDRPLTDLALSYRRSELPRDVIVTRLELRADSTAPSEEVLSAIERLQARRAESQPLREKTSGSTFANPDPPGTAQQRRAWKLIEEAGCRGLRVGGAQVSDKHCNFLINTGAATAADLEALGELVRARVLATSGIALRWEVRRLGRLQALLAPENPGP
ncbi:MAG: UDP-N-acetylenolpyruvoylglucosamine reductase [Alphaproteobacteria bacterium]|jgi:UDP-N-acetylmuramate dehydrogenase|nr:UDP-N-acetylenolpyruvoylglucosamine reductase [Alphaproteobacteria bacterium]